MPREYASKVMHNAIAYHPVPHAQPVPKWQAVFPSQLPKVGFF